MTAELDIFDPYELQARIFPAIIIALPVVIAFAAILDAIVGDKFRPASSLAVVTLATLPLVYLVGMYISGVGNSAQSKLAQEWGGLPTTQILRWRDERLDDDLKADLHAAVRKEFGIMLLSRDEEFTDPAGADTLIQQANLRARFFVRRHNPQGLWRVHLAEYGFQRNLLANRDIWIGLSSLSFLVLALLTLIAPAGGFARRALKAGLVINMLPVLVAALIGWGHLPQATRLAAFDYAFSLWNAFLAHAS